MEEKGNEKEEMGFLLMGSPQVGNSALAYESAHINKIQRNENAMYDCS